MMTKTKAAFGAAGGIALAATLALAPQSARATPAPAFPSGSLAFAAGVNGFTNTDSVNQIDATTTQILVSQPGINVNPSTGNLNIAAFSSEEIGPAVAVAGPPAESNVTILIPTHAISLATPITVTVGGFVFSFDTEALNGVPVAGNVGVKFTGVLVSSPAGFTPLANQTADLSIAFTESSVGGSPSAAFSLDTPEKFVVDAPEPASMALLGTGLLGMGLIRRRKHG